LNAPMAKDANRTDEPVVRVVGLVKRFGDRTVLDGVDLEVYPGETMVVMGGSGCGKSTLLRHMIGSMWPDEGRVELFGQDLSDLSENELDALRRRFGILFQSGALFNSITVGENVALPLREHTDLDDDTIEIIVRIKLELVGLRYAVDLMPSEISGGMKKRAGLARAIALDPEILFYDEPSAGHFRRDRSVDDRPVQQAGSRQRGGYPRDGFGLQNRRSNGDAGRGRDAENRPAERLRGDSRRRAGRR